MRHALDHCTSPIVNTHHNPNLSIQRHHRMPEARRGINTKTERERKQKVEKWN